MNIQPGQSAFPVAITEQSLVDSGIDVRTYIATSVLSKIATLTRLNTEKWEQKMLEEVKLAVLYADYLISELNQK